MLLVPFHTHDIIWDEEHQEFLWKAHHPPIKVSDLMDQMIDKVTKSTRTAQLEEIEVFVCRLFDYLETYSFRLSRKLGSQKEVLLQKVAFQKESLKGKKTTIVANILSSSISSIKTYLEHSHPLKKVRDLLPEDIATGVSPFLDQVHHLKNLPLQPKELIAGSRYSCLVCCDQTVEQILKDHSSIKVLQFEHYELLTEEGWKHLKNMTSLQEIVFPKEHGTRLRQYHDGWELFLERDFSVGMLAQLITFFEIKTLHISKKGGGLLKEIFSYWPQGQQISSLILEEIDVTTQDQKLLVEFLNSCDLKTLKVHNTTSLLSQTLEKMLSSQKKLKVLSLDLPSDPIGVLKSLHRCHEELEELHLYCSLNTPKDLLQAGDFEFLSFYRHLKKISIIRAPLHPKLFKILNQITSLQELDLSYPLLPKNLKHLDTCHLQDLKNLRVLKWNHSYACDCFIKYLANMSLQHLELENVQGITRHGWIALSYCVHLTHLNLAFTHSLTADGLRALCEHCAFLETLSLEGHQQLSSESLRYLYALHYLKSVNLKRTQANWIVIEALSLAHYLKCLEISLSHHFPLSAFKRVLETLHHESEIQPFAMLEVLSLEVEEKVEELSALKEWLPSHIKVELTSRL